LQEGFKIQNFASLAVSAFFQSTCIHLPKMARLPNPANALLFIQNANINKMAK
jgi:hypothetical protein